MEPNLRAEVETVAKSDVRYHMGVRSDPVFDEDMSMPHSSTPISLRSMILTGRTGALAAVAAMSLACAVSGPARADSIAAASMQSSAAVAGATDFSAARRHRHVRRGGGGGAAAAAAFAGIVGTIGAIAATQAQRDDYYDGPYGYGGGPYYAEPYYGRPYSGSNYGGYGYRQRLDGGGNIIP